MIALLVLVLIRLSEPIVTPWETGTINGGDATELQLDAYYVKEHATGNATGMDWDDNRKRTYNLQM